MSASQYAGANWIKRNWPEKEMSPLGEAVADLLGDLFLGIYHLDPKQLFKVDWANKSFIEFSLGWQCLSTIDYNYLTVLVVLAHDRCIRVQIEASTHKYLRLTFHQRTREGDYAHRHPSLEEHVAVIRKHYSQNEAAIRAAEEAK